MLPRSLQFIAAACQGEIRFGPADAVVTRVITDSRGAQPGDLFVALAGERFDGHNFVAEAAGRRRVTAAVVERGKAPANDPGCPLVVVENSRRALGQMATAHRAEFQLPVVAVVGSNGKTTTKELLVAVLRRKFSVLASAASFNNDVGVPLTLLQLDATHGVAVLEAGTNHPGELKPLLELIGPHYGVLTSIGREHLEFFSDLAGVAREEGAIAGVLPAGGRLFLPGDNEWTAEIAGRTGAPVSRIGLGAANDWRLDEAWVSADGIRFRCTAPRPEYSGQYALQLLGRHQALNALFALALGAELGLAAGQIRDGLAECLPPKLRGQTWEAHGVRVIEDCYNANADSMAAALELLREMPARGRRVAILGDMAELGEHSVAAHREVGRRAVEAGVDRLVAVGPRAAEIADAARATGLRDVIEFADVPAAIAAIRLVASPGDVVLLKASRAMAFERIGQALK